MSGRKVVQELKGGQRAGRYLVVPESLLKAGLSPAEAIVWAKLNLMEGLPQGARPSYSTLSQHLGMARQTVVSIVKRLVEMGYVHVENQVEGKRWSSNVYHTLVPADGEPSDPECKEIGGGCTTTHTGVYENLPPVLKNKEIEKKELPERAISNKYRRAVLGIWSQIHSDRGWPKFLVTPREAKSAGFVADLAVEEKWDLSRLEKFLRSGVDYLLADSYWKTRVCLGGILVRANEIVASIDRKVPEAELTDYGAYRDELAAIANGSS